MYYYVSVHHFETAAVTQQQVHCYRGTVEGGGGWGLCCSQEKRWLLWRNSVMLRLRTAKIT